MNPQQICLILLFLVEARATTTINQSEVDYPNPKYDFKSCNRPKRSYICNMDSVITEKEANSLDWLAEEMTMSTTCVCTQCQSKNSGVKIGIFIKYNLTFHKENMNSSDLSLFAKKVRQQWNFGPCGDDILIVLLAQTKHAQFDIGPAVEKVIPRKIVRQIFNECSIHFENDYFYQGLESMINSYRDALRRLQPRPKETSKTGLYVGISLGVVVLITILIAAALLKSRQMRRMRFLQSMQYDKNTDINMFQYQLCKAEEEEKNGNGSISSDEGIDSDDEGKNCDTVKLHIPPFSDTFKRQLSAVVEENEDDIEAAAIKFAMVNTPQNSSIHITEL